MPRGQIILGLAVLVAGCVSTPQNTEIGNETSVGYGENVSYEKAYSAQVALSEIGWEGNATVKSVNESWHRIDMNTTDRPEREIGQPREYKIQITLSRMQAGEFTQEDNILLILRDEDGDVLHRSVRR